MLLPSPASRQAPAAPTPSAIVVVARPGSSAVLERAVAQAARHRVVLHVVVAERRTSPLHVLFGLRRPTAPALPAHLDRAAHLGVHVEVHPIAGCPHALADGLAETLGAAVLV